MIIDKLVYSVFCFHIHKHIPTSTPIPSPAIGKHFFALAMWCFLHVWDLICVLHIQDCTVVDVSRGWFWLWRRNKVVGWIRLNRKKKAERACLRAAGSSINRFICFFIALKWKWGYDGCQQNDDDGYWRVKGKRWWSGQFGEVVAGWRRRREITHSYTHRELMYNIDFCPLLMYYIP